MTETKHTDGAVKAAVEVIRELRLLVPSGDINAPKGTLAIQGTEIDLKDIAAIIDQETAAPDLLQLFAERDRLRAEKAELVEALACLDRIAALISDDRHQNLVTSDNDWSELYSARVKARAALNKVEPTPEKGDCRDG